MMMDRAQKEKILQELGGLPEEVYDQLCRELLSQIDGFIGDMEKALAGGNYGEAAKIAHFIKGATANLRLYNIRDGAMSIEKACKGGVVEAVDTGSLICGLKAAVCDCKKGM